MNKRNRARRLKEYRSELAKLSNFVKNRITEQNDSEVLGVIEDVDLEMIESQIVAWLRKSYPYRPEMWTTMLKVMSIEIDAPTQGGSGWGSWSTEASVEVKADFSSWVRDMYPDVPSSISESLKEVLLGSFEEEQDGCSCADGEPGFLGDIILDFSHVNRVGDFFLPSHIHLQLEHWLSCR